MFYLRIYMRSGMLALAERGRSVGASIKVWIMHVRLLLTKPTFICHINFIILLYTDDVMW